MPKALGPEVAGTVRATVAARESVMGDMRQREKVTPNEGTEEAA